MQGFMLVADEDKLNRLVTLSEIGYRANLTVLFADIAESSYIVDKLDPEDADYVLNSVIDIFIQQIEQFNGVMNQALGDGAMALFGVHDSDHNHALRALGCAQNIIQDVARLSDEIEEKYGISVKVRVGLNTGEVVVRQADQKYFAQYRAVGSVVHETDRIQKAAFANGICISDTARRNVEKYINIIKSEVLDFGQDSKSKTVFHVELRDMDEARFFESGREATVYIRRSRIENSLLKLLNSEARPVYIVADAGIGKTSLVKSLVSQNNLDVTKVLKWDFLPNFLTKPHDFLRFLLSECAKRESIFSDIQDNENDIEQFCGAHAINTDYSLEALFYLNDMETRNERFDALEDDQKSLLAAKVVAHLVFHVFKNRNYVFVFEDLHWIRRVDLNFFSEFFKIQGRFKPKIICTGRKPPQDTGLSKENFYTRELPPLTERQTLKILDQYLGTDLFLSDIKKKIYKLTAGNPFFIKEIALSILQAGHLENLKASLKEASTIIDNILPGNIQDIYAARYNALDAEHQHVLSLFSILGYRFNIRLAQALFNDQGFDVFDIARSLEKKLFIHKIRDFPYVEYEFNHAYLQKGIYAQVLKSEKRKLHEKVFLFLGRSREYRSKVDSGYFAYHAEGAEDFGYAYVLNKRAALSSLNNSDFTLALEFIDRALVSLNKFHNKNKVDQRKAELYLHKLEALIMGKQRSVFEVTLAKAQAQIEKARTPDIQARFLNFLTRDHWVKGDLVSAEEKAREFLDLSYRLRREDLKIRGHHQLGGILIDRGKFQEAVDHHRYVIEQTPSSKRCSKFGLLIAAYPASLACLAYAYAHMGEFSLSHRYMALAYDFADEIPQDTFTRTYIFSIAAYNYLVQGEAGAAMPYLEKAYKEAAQSEITLLMALSRYTLGYSYLMHGNLKKAGSLIKEARSSCKKNSFVWDLTRIDLIEIESLMHQAKWQQAQQKLERLLCSSRISAEQYYQTHAKYLLAFCMIKTFQSRKNENHESIISLLDEAEQEARINFYKPLMCKILLLKYYFLKSQNLDSLALQAHRRYQDLQKNLQSGSGFFRNDFIKDQFITA